MLLLGIVEPQRYSSELFCHSGLEPYIWVQSSLLLGYWISFIIALISSAYYTIYSVLCLSHIVLIEQQGCFLQI